MNTHPHVSIPTPAAASVFAGLDICEAAGLARVPGSTRPMYDDDVWDLTGLAQAHRSFFSHEKILDFTLTQTRRWRPVAKDIVLALLAPQHEQVLAVPSAYRIPRHPRTCHNNLRKLVAWFNWLTHRQVPSLQEVTQHHCDAYLDEASWSRCETEQPRRRSAGTMMGFVHAMQLPALYGPLLRADGYREGFTPWSGRPPTTVTGWKSSGENSTRPLPDEVLQPLLATSLYLVDVIGPHLADLLERIRCESTDEPEELVATSKQWSRRHAVLVEHQMLRYRHTATPLPRCNDREIRRRLKAGWHPDDLLLPLNLGRIARDSGLYRLPSHVATSGRLRTVLETAVRQVGIAPPWARNAALVPRADTGELLPWTEPLTADHAHLLARHVLTACLLITAAVTGMRTEELAEISVGAWRVAEDIPGGGRRYRLASKRIKGCGLGGMTDEWVIVEEVDRAVALAERLTGAADGEQLFGTINIRTRYQNLRRWLHQSWAVRLGLAPLPDACVTARMLRRTLALEMAKRPAGLFATKIALKHLSAATTEGYTARPGGSQAAFHAEVEHAEHQHHLELTVTAFRDYQNGIRPSGPGARDLIRTFQHVDAELNDLAHAEPTVLDNDRRLENLLRKQANVLHVGAAN
jgi:hypothetical protein